MVTREKNIIIQGTSDFTWKLLGAQKQIQKGEMLNKSEKDPNSTKLAN